MKKKAICILLTGAISLFSAPQSNPKGTKKSTPSSGSSESPATPKKPRFQGIYISLKSGELLPLSGYGYDDSHYHFANLTNSSWGDTTDYICKSDVEKLMQKIKKPEFVGIYTKWSCWTDLSTKLFFASTIKNHDYAWVLGKRVQLNVDPVDFQKDYTIYYEPVNKLEPGVYILRNGKEGGCNVYWAFFEIVE